jgi:hypothetical protein
MLMHAAVLACADKTSKSGVMRVLLQPAHAGTLVLQGNLHVLLQLIQHNDHVICLTKFDVFCFMQALLTAY